MDRYFYFWCFIIITIGGKDNVFCGLFLTERKNSKDWSLCAAVPPFTRSDTGSVLNSPHGPQRRRPAADGQCGEADSPRPGGRSALG